MVIGQKSCLCLWVLFKCLIKRLNVSSCSDISWWRIREKLPWLSSMLSRNKQHVSNQYIFTDRRIWQINVFYEGHPDSLVPKSCSCSKETVKSHFVFWFIFKEFASVPRVKFPFCYSKNEVSKYISVACTRSNFFIFFCSVLSYLFITAYIWHCSERLFFSDFCSSNVCFLSVASGEQKLLFMVWQKHLTFWHQCRLKQLGLINKRVYYFWM